MLYDSGAFADIKVDESTDPALAKFVLETLNKGPKFSNYKPETLELFLNRIYELRKN